MTSKRQSTSHDSVAPLNRLDAIKSNRRTAPLHLCEKREDGALDREGVSAEQRPPLAQANWDAANALMKMASELARSWTQLSQNLHSSIETPFADHNLPSEHDGFGVSDLLFEIGQALIGMHSWAGIRAAHTAMRGAKRVQGERQIVAIERCTWALVAWKKVARKRRPHESEADHALRLKALRPTEDRIISILLACLTEQEPAFRKLRAKSVRDHIESLLKERENASPLRLLVGLSSVAGVWPETSEASLKDLKKKKKRQPGSG